MVENRAIAQVVIAVVMVAGTGSALVESGASQASTPSSTENKNATVEETPARSGTPSTGREYKGKLDPVGPFQLRDFDGRSWTEHDFSGKVLIAVQWAAWCGPCVSEFPQVQKLYEMVRSDPSITFVSLDLDTEPAKIGAFLQDFRKEYSFPVLAAGSRFKIKSLPCTWIVDREGYIRETLRGSGPGWLEQVRALAEAVKSRPPVSTLSIEVRQAQRDQNEQDAANTR